MTLMARVLSAAGAFVCLVLAGCGGDGNETASPPAQAEPPPIETTASGATIEGPIGRGASEVYLFRPSGRPRAIVVFGHGWGDITPVKYRPWMDHLLAGNVAVIYPRYQPSPDPPVGEPREVVKRAFRQGIDAAFERLGDPDVPVVATGFSYGAVMAYYYAGKAAGWGRPVPRAVQIIFPARSFGEPLPSFPKRTRVLIQAGDRDEVVGAAGADLLWLLVESHPRQLKQYEVVRSRGGFVASHLAPQGTSAAAQRAFWKPLDDLIDAAVG